MAKGTETAEQLEAVKAITEALGPLAADTRERVLEASLALLGMRGPAALTAAGPPGQTPALAPSDSRQANLPASYGDIRSLTEAKDPTTDIQMAAIVAYYLAECAPTTEHKDVIGTEDIRKYFHQAKYELPNKPRYTLPNAKNAGYFDSVGQGKYKLNPVGYNLVTHRLPEQGGDAKVAKRRAKKVSKAPAKKVAKRK